MKYQILDILNRNTGCTVYPQYLNRVVELKDSSIDTPLKLSFLVGGDITSDNVLHIERQDSKLSIVTTRHIWLLSEDWI